MANKTPDAPYVVEDQEIIDRFKKHTLGKAQERMYDIIQMLRDNPGKPIAIPKGYLHPSSFSNYNKISEDDHVSLRGAAEMERGETNVYYAFLKKGKSGHGTKQRQELRRKQKAKRVAQSNNGKRPEDFPEPELIDEHETQSA